MPLLLLLYATIVILQGWWPWHIFLRALIAARPRRPVRGKRQEADVSTTPARMLKFRRWPSPATRALQQETAKGGVGSPFSFRHHIGFVSGFIM